MMTLDELHIRSQKVAQARKEFHDFFTQSEMDKWDDDERVAAEELAWRMFLAGKGIKPL